MPGYLGATTIWALGAVGKTSWLEGNTAARVPGCYKPFGLSG